MTKPQQFSSLVKVIQAVSETVREAGEVPAGTIYAALSAQGCTLIQFDQIISILTQATLIKRTGDIIRWTGPTIA